MQWKTSSQTASGTLNNTQGGSRKQQRVNNGSALSTIRGAQFLAQLHDDFTHHSWLASFSMSSTEAIAQKTLGRGSTLGLDDTRP
jgi:hypothetical protein